MTLPALLYAAAADVELWAGYAEMALAALAVGCLYVWASFTEGAA